MATEQQPQQPQQHTGALPRAGANEGSQQQQQQQQQQEQQQKQ